jgi:hypothetical protein
MHRNISGALRQDCSVIFAASLIFHSWLKQLPFAFSGGLLCCPTVLPHLKRSLNALGELQQSIEAEHGPSAMASSRYDR